MGPPAPDFGQVHAALPEGGQCRPSGAGPWDTLLVSDTSKGNTGEVWGAAQEARGGGLW